MPPDNDIFGKWAWPNNRRVKRKDVGTEPDTDAETRAHNALKNFFHKNTPIPHDIGSEILDALQSGLYPDVLKPPPEGHLIQRGMTVHYDWLATALKLRPGQRIPRNGSSSARYTFVPRKGCASSWTTNSEIADQFSCIQIPMNSNDEPPWAVKLTASRDHKNMIYGPHGLYDVEDFGVFFEEYEVVAIGPVRVLQISWDARLNDDAPNDDYLYGEGKL